LDEAGFVLGDAFVQDQSVGELLGSPTDRVGTVKRRRQDLASSLFQEVADQFLLKRNRGRHQDPERSRARPPCRAPIPGWHPACSIPAGCAAARLPTPVPPWPLRHHFSLFASRARGDVAPVWTCLACGPSPPAGGRWP